ncbi:MAG: hypothetical protein KA044_00380, partial [Elusimicrobia bacterium]|nr:hypothetical protein [Elusimicrobiota bacterium]
MRSSSFSWLWGKKKATGMAAAFGDSAPGTETPGPIGGGAAPGGEGGLTGGMGCRGAMGGGPPLRPPGRSEGTADGIG